MKKTNLSLGRLQNVMGSASKVAILGALNQQFSLQFTMLMDKRYTHHRKYFQQLKVVTKS